MLSNFKSNALWGGTVLKNDGTVKGAVRWARRYGTVGRVRAVRWVRWVRYGGYGGYHRTVPTVPYPPYRTHRKCHMFLPVLNHQETCFSFLLKLDNIYVTSVGADTRNLFPEIGPLNISQNQ